MPKSANGTSSIASNAASRSKSTASTTQTRSGNGKMSSSSSQSGGVSKSTVSSGGGLLGMGGARGSYAAPSGGLLGSRGGGISTPNASGSPRNNPVNINVTPGNGSLRNAMTQRAAVRNMAPQGPGASLLSNQYSQYRSPSPMDGAEDLTRNAYMADQRSQYRSPPGVNAMAPQAQASEGIYGPSGLRGLLGPQGQPRIQPTAGTTSYQTAQMMRGMYPGIDKKTDQTRLADALGTFGQAMPSEADIGRFGPGAMNDIGRVGLNQVIGGFSPERMVSNMDSTQLRAGTKGKGYMVGADSPQAMLAQVSLREAIQNQGVSPQAQNASNFVAAGTPMVPGVNKAGAPVNGTQFGDDPTWGNRIAMRNELGATRLAANGLGVTAPTGPTQVASINPAVAPPSPQQAQPIPQPMTESAPSMWEKYAPNALQAAATAVDQNLIQPTKDQIEKYGGFERAGSLARMAVGIMNFLPGGGGPGPEPTANDASKYASYSGAEANTDPHAAAATATPAPVTPPVNPMQPWSYPQYSQQWAGLPTGIGGYARG